MAHSPASDSIRIDVDHRDEITIAKLTGSADMTATEQMKEQLLSLVEDPCRLLVLDLSGLEFISSEGLGAIIAAHVRSRRHEGRVVLAAPSSQIRHLLSVTSLDRLLPIYDSVEEALRGGAEESPG